MSRRKPSTTIQMHPKAKHPFRPGSYGEWVMDTFDGLRRLERAERITSAQEAVFTLMLASPFNDFDPAQIVTDLRENKAAWRSVVFGRWSLPELQLGLPTPYLDLLMLRDLEDGIYHADTLLIFTEQDTEAAQATFTQFAASWQASAFRWLSRADIAHCAPLRERLGLPTTDWWAGSGLAVFWWG